MTENSEQVAQGNRSSRARGRCFPHPTFILQSQGHVFYHRKRIKHTRSCSWAHTGEVSFGSEKSTITLLIFLEEDICPSSTGIHKDVPRTLLLGTGCRCKNSKGSLEDNPEFLRNRIFSNILVETSAKLSKHCWINSINCKTGFWAQKLSNCSFWGLN